MRFVWFLFGFVFSVAYGLQFVNASCQYDLADPIGFTSGQWGVSESYSKEYIGIYDTALNAYNACVNASGGMKSGNISFSVYINGTYIGGIKGTYYIPNQSANFAWYDLQSTEYDSFICNSAESPIDSDGDGISDLFDLNGDSTSEYTAAIQKLLYNQSTGEVAAGEILLDNGAVYKFGSVPADMEGYTITEFTGSFLDWKSGLEIQDILTSANIDGSSIVTYDSVEIDESGNIAGFGVDELIPSTIDDSNDDKLVSSNPSDGTETDNQALQKIVDNTANASNNIQRLGDYLSDINKSLKSIDTSTAITTNNTTNSNSTTTTTTQEISNEGIDQIADALGTSSEIASAKSQSDSDLAGIDTSDESFSYENSNERTALQNEISAMSSDGTLSTLINENTGDIDTLNDFKNSGISIVNPTSVIQMDLGPFGQHTIDFGLDIFQSFYAAIAAFLYPFTILLSYFIILKG